jgi:anti-sigma regulatory factor (Ser/Thr protein kinase)
MEPEGGVTGRAADMRAAGRTRGAGPVVAGAPARLTSAAHLAAFYRTASEYAETVGGFIRSGLDHDDPVAAAVPRPSALLLAEFLGVHADRVNFADMATLGRNPARIMPAIQAFAESHRGQQVRYVAEPVWRARTAPEQAEAIRHEALLNIAFPGQPITILCPYHSVGLESGVLAAAGQTHPALLRAGQIEPSAAFAGANWQPAADGPLPEPPAGLESLTYREEPGMARTFVRQQAWAAGLREPRITDLVIAVGELAANTVRHTPGTGIVRVWGTPVEVICEMRDSGHIRDSLAGRRRPAADAAGGHGLWVVHQVCDLAEMRTGSSGTTFRLHMSLGG